MLQLSIGEKLEVFKKIIFSSPSGFLALLIILFIGFLFITTNRHNGKDSKKLYILLYITCFLALFIRFSSSFRSLIDYFMNHVFVLIYFPNLAIYLLAIIINNIVMWKSMFQNNDKTLKVINTISFCAIHYMLILLLMVISKNNLNIFEITSIYGNKEALSLIELSSLVFIFWILLLIIHRGITYILGRQKELVLDEIPKESKYNSENQKSYVVLEPPQEVLKKEVAKAEEKELELELYESMLTVDDYKLLLELLRKHRYQEEIREEELKEQYSNERLETLYGKAK